MGNALTLYRRHSHIRVGGQTEWVCRHRDSRVFSARPNPVTLNGSTFTMLVHEPAPRSKRDLAKDCDCPIVCDGWLANERERIRRRSLGTNDWTQAKNLAAQWLKWGQLVAPIKAAVAVSEPISIEYAIERFFKSKGPEGENLDPATLRKYKVLLNDRLLTWCAAHGIHAMKQMESKVACEDFVLSWRDLNPGRNRRNARRTEKLLARSTKVAELGRLGYFLDYCVNSGWLVQNSAKKVKVESRGRGEPKYGLNPGEYERVLNEANSWTDSWGNPGGRKAKEIQVMVQLLRWSGLRISDAAMLEENQVRKDGNRYTVVIERMEKTGNTVRVPIPQFVGDALQALPRKGMRNGKRYWFWTCAGEPDTCVNAWRNDIAKLIHSAQRPDERGRYHDPFEHRASTHTLRHTFACLALAAGATLQQVKEWLGHTSVRTTEKHYGHANRHAQTVLDAAYDAMVAETMRQYTNSARSKIVGIKKRA